MLPANRLDANAIKLLNLFPAPNHPGLFTNYTSNPVINNDTDQFDVRVDHNISSKDSAFGRLSYMRNPEIIPGPFGGVADGGAFYAGNQDTRSWNSALSETHAFSPTFVNEFRLGYNHLQRLASSAQRQHRGNSQSNSASKAYHKAIRMAGWVPFTSQVLTPWAAANTCLRSNSAPRHRLRTT